MYFYEDKIPIGLWIFFAAREWQYNNDSKV